MSTSQDLRDTRGKSRFARAALAVVLWFAPTFAAASDSAVLAVAVGEVEIESGQPPVWQPARDGEQLAPGSAVRTGRGGRAEIAFGPSTVRLYEFSLLRIPEQTGDGQETLEFNEGRSLFDVLHREAEDHFRVKTPEAVVSVKGTRFGLERAAQGLAVAVYRGAVGVSGMDAASRETLVPAGFVAQGGAAEIFQVQSLAHADPWETWSSGAAPPRLFETEGDAPTSDTGDSASDAGDGQETPGESSAAPEEASGDSEGTAMAPEETASDPGETVGELGGTTGDAAASQPQLEVDVLAPMRETPEITQKVLPINGEISGQMNLLEGGSAATTEGVPVPEKRMAPEHGAPLPPPGGSDLTGGPTAGPTLTLDQQGAIGLQGSTQKLPMPPPPPPGSDLPPPPENPPPPPEGGGSTSGGNY